MLSRVAVVEDQDRRIVELLRQDGRMSYTDLGKAMGMSTSAVHQRVRRLEERGVIKGYAAVVDYSALNVPLTAFISITPLDPAAPDDIPERLHDLPEIEACHSVAGDENYILKTRVRTPGDLEDLLARVRATANVATRTTVVLSTPWE
jgi:Lrp/AsnC family transcriptional regulator, leucine-responsive regulatory protein